MLLPRSAIVIGDQARIVEHLRYDESGRTLNREYTLDNPLYLGRHYSGRNVSDISLGPYQNFSYVDLSGENNRRPDAP